MLLTVARSMIGIEKGSDKMTQTDGIILGLPVYTTNVSANIQAFLEWASVATDMNRSENLLRHKVGAAVTAARLPRLMQCSISLCCKICMRSVPLIGQWRMGRCRGMSGKTRKVLKQ